MTLEKPAERSSSTFVGLGVPGKECRAQQNRGESVHRDGLMNPLPFGLGSQKGCALGANGQQEIALKETAIQLEGLSMSGTGLGNSKCRPSYLHSRSKHTSFLEQGDIILGFKFF